MPVIISPRYHKTNSYVGGIEAGGSKFICAIASSEGETIKQARFATSDPRETLQRAVEFFQENIPRGKDSEFESVFSSLGIGAFGPVGVNARSSDYGRILNTPKRGGEGVDLIEPFKAAFPELKVLVDTDVNVAALGEGRFGIAKGLDSYVYITVGTGIGGGVVVNNEIIKGLLHSEIGHVSIRREEEDFFEGACPFHSDCIEGLASGEAIMQRWGHRAECLPPGHVAWELESKYIASLCQTLTAVLSPQRIILGGGVMEQGLLLAMVRERFQEKVGGYWEVPSDYIVTSGLGGQAGITGALCLAQEA